MENPELHFPNLPGSDNHPPVAFDFILDLRGKERTYHFHFSPKGTPYEVSITVKTDKFPGEYYEYGEADSILDFLRKYISVSFEYKQHSFHGGFPHLREVLGGVIELANQEDLQKFWVEVEMLADK